MPGLLSGRTAMITGASGATGAAAAHALSKAGASVVLAAGDDRAAEALAAEINAAGGQAVTVPTDLTSPVSVRRLVEQTLGAFGRLDVAVVVGGLTPVDEIADAIVSLCSPAAPEAA